MKLPNEFTLEEMTLEKLNKVISQPNFVGVIRDLPDELYHKCRGLSRSAIIEAKDNISNYLDYLASDYEETPAMRFGTALHCAILEPKKFQATYVAEPSKEDFEGLLESSDDLRNHLKTLINTDEEKKELQALEKQLTACEEKHPKDIKAVEDTMAKLKADIEARDFKTKKEMNEEIKKALAPSKSTLVIMKKEQKKEIDTYKANIKDTKKAISTKEMALKGTKAAMTAEIRKYDKDVNIWEEIISDFREGAKDKNIISQNDLLVLSKIMNNAKRRTELVKYMSQGFSELTIFWTDPTTGLLLKARIDFLSFFGQKFTPLDIKSCLCAEEFKFVKDIFNKGYYFQEAMYLEGLNIVLGPICQTEIKDFVYVAAEKLKACEVNEIELGDVSKEKGQKDFRDTLDKIANYYSHVAQEQEIYTGYEQGVTTIEMPIYALA